MTTPDVESLFLPMCDDQWEGGHIAVLPLAEEHREGLRACCDPDDPVWEIYPVNYSGANFDLAFAMLGEMTDRTFFAILEGGVVRGITAFIGISPTKLTLEIGGTFMAQDARGTGLNSRVKKLLLDRVFGAGFRRVEFKVDERNARSQAAVLKLGATKEGVLRAERITWTGHVRDTGLFSILASEWSGQTKRHQVKSVP